MSEHRKDTAFALAVRAPGGGPWQFLSAVASAGNLMRTTSPFHARTWASVADLQAWVDECGQNADRIHASLAGKGNTPARMDKLDVEYAVVPLAMATCPSSRTVKLRTLQVKGRQADQGEEYHLS